MFATSGDVLNMSLALGVILIAIFLCIALFYLILVLRDTSRTTRRVEELVGRVHATIVEPLRAVDFIFEKIRPYIELTVERLVSKAKKRK